MKTLETMEALKGLSPEQIGAIVEAGRDLCLHTRSPWKANA